MNDLVAKAFGDIVADSTVRAVHQAMLDEGLGDEEGAAEKLPSIAWAITDKVTRHMHLVQGWTPPSESDRWILGLLRHNVATLVGYDKARVAFLQWITSFDDPDPESPGARERRVVTLDQVIRRANEVLHPLQSMPPEPVTGDEVLASVRYVWGMELEAELGVWERMDPKDRPNTQISHVLWHVGHPHGQKPGEFTATLINTIRRADLDNSRKLRTLYPELTLACQIVRDVPQGTERLAALLWPRE